MRLLLLPDLHLRVKRPRMRLDVNYSVAQWHKVSQIFDIGVEEGCDYVLQPGDFFDSIDTPWSVVRIYIRLFRKYDLNVLAVRGQHDLRYHTRNVENIPLAVMEASGVVVVIPNHEFVIDEGVAVYGCSWNEEIPEIKDESKFNILVLHKMVVEDKTWEGQEDFTYGKHMFRKYGYDLFVCGDNHKHFTFTHSTKSSPEVRHLVNCGSLMRANIDQVDHTPCCYVFDTETKELTQRLLKVKKNVLDIKGASKDKKLRDERLEVLDTLAGVLDSIGDLGLNFFGNIKSGIKNSRLKKPVVDIIEEVMDSCGNKKSR